jgi:hypothetical protein
MDHLNDNLLNQYLDSDLKTTEALQVEAHLSSCPICAARLESLLSLSKVLRAYQENAMPHNLAPFIMERLPRQPIHSPLRLILIVQTAITLGLVGVLLGAVTNPARSFQAFIAGISRWRFLSLPIPSGPWSFTFPGLGRLAQLLGRAFLLPVGPVIFGHFLNLETVFAFRGLSPLLIGAATTAMWILGNAVLLHHRAEVHK